MVKSSLTGLVNLGACRAIKVEAYHPRAGAVLNLALLSFRGALGRRRLVQVYVCCNPTTIAT